MGEKCTIGNCYAPYELVKRCWYNQGGPSFKGSIYLDLCEFHQDLLSSDKLKRLFGINQEGWLKVGWDQPQDDTISSLNSVDLPSSI